MKRTVLVFGLIAGLIVSVVMLASVTMCYHSDDFEGSMFVGYASMIIAFSFVFIGIRSFRNKYNGGAITFGRAFQIGLYICLIASTFYVVAWLIDYYLFVPDFMDRYIAHVLKQAEAGGASQAELQKQAAEMADFKEMYKNPLAVVAITYAEILPVGLVVTLISALVLKRKPQPSSGVPA